MTPRDDTATARAILERGRTWAVVGCSPDPTRDSSRVARFLRSRGYRVVPVNPTADEVLGERCYPDLASIPSSEAVDVVDVFRRSDQAGTHWTRRSPSAPGRCGCSSAWSTRTRPSAAVPPVSRSS